MVKKKHEEVVVKTGLGDPMEWQRGSMETRDSTTPVIGKRRRRRKR